MNPTSLSLSEGAALVAARKLSPVEWTQATLERIARIDPQLNCYITLPAESAMSQAHEAEAEIGAGHYRGALHGAPLALKDLYETKGVRTTAGSDFLRDHIPEADCTVVSKLNRAGAVSLGKLNMHEFAAGVTNDNPHFGACKNPWAPERIPGGSSGGSAAAVAARLCAGSLGSDTAGSIRMPASLCGIVGLKPSRGRVSLRGVIPLSWNLDHAGPMAQRVRDTALLLQAIAGYDADDPYSINAPLDDYLKDIDGGIKGWRVGIARGYFAEADAEVLRAVEAATMIFAQLGAQTSEVNLDIARDPASANGVMLTSDAAAFHRERLRDDPERFGPGVLTMLQFGAACASSDYALARYTQAQVRREFERFFENYDVLLTPTTPSAAPLRDGANTIETGRLLLRFTSPFNFTGLPALSVPCGFTAEGLPIGLQIVGPAWSEARVLRAGHAYEQATDWHKREPLIVG